MEEHPLPLEQRLKHNTTYAMIHPVIILVTATARFRREHARTQYGMVAKKC